jgi:hypothetical protein
MDATHTEAPAAGEGVRAEVAAIATDTNHPMHFGYHRGDASVMKHIDSLYQKAVGTAPVQIDQEGITTGGPPTPLATPVDADIERTPAQLAQDSETDRTLRAVLGEGYDAEMSDARIGVQYFFSIPNGEQVVKDLSPLVEALGPEGDVWSIRALGELGRLCQAKLIEQRRTT